MALKATLLEPEVWSYIIHLRLPKGRIMEIKGEKKGTAEEVEALAVKFSKEYSGEVHRVTMRQVSEQSGGKARVRNMPASSAVPSLPAPEPTKAAASSRSGANKHFIPAYTLSYPVKTSAIHITNKETSSNDYSESKTSG